MIHIMVPSNIQNTKKNALINQSVIKRLSGRKKKNGGVTLFPSNTQKGNF